ncbi:MAG: DUF4142 domain-containing protein [Bacteroidetes bacterium]|nr:DUF4142 domain-containing protein [Bacteroidota bacterium]
MAAKTFSNFHIIKSVILFVLCYNLSSCKQENKKEEDSKDIANKFNDAKFDDSKEAKFLVDATELCYEELELARLAQSNGTNDNVKEIATMMEKDNTQLLEEIKKLAQSKDITIPSEITSKGQKERKKLSDDNEKNFNKTYCDMVVDNHKKAVKKYMSAVEDCEDAEVKNWAGKSLVILRNHLDHAMTCSEAYNQKKEDPDKMLKKDMKEVDSHTVATKTQTSTSKKSDETKGKTEKKTDGDSKKEEKNKNDKPSDTEKK